MTPVEYSEMDYQKHYVEIIRNRLENPLPKGVYCERHHILPKAEGGVDRKCNLVRLTAREHYVCHLLLARIYDDRAMWWALQCMSMKSSNQERSYKMNSRLFDAMKRKMSGLMSEIMKGEKNPFYGKCHTETTKMKMSEAKKGEKHPLYGKHHSEETRKKISKSHRDIFHSEASRRKMSEAHKGKYSEGTRRGNEKRMTPIQAFRDGVLVGTFESQHEAARQLDCNQGNIRNVLGGRAHQTKGYTFKYAQSA